MGKKLNELDEATVLAAADILHIRGLDGVDKRITAENAILDLIAARHQSVDGGYINTNDWTNRHLGSVNIIYDNLAGSFIVGETITEEISGNTGIVMTDSGTILVLSDVTGTGVFTNDREITGTDSGATADVDGDTKNVDTNFHHGYDAPLSDLLVKVLVSTDGTDINSFEIKGQTYNSVIPDHWGFAIHQVDNDNLLVQTCLSGIPYVRTLDGTIQIIFAQDWCYKIKVYLLG